MNVLALDCATKTGWAAWVDGRLESGVKSFGFRRGDSRGCKLARFHLWFDDMLIEYRPARIVYEQAHHQGGDATRLLLGFTAYVDGRSFFYGVRHCEAVHTQTLKKAATGSGRADKPLMIQAAKARWGIDIIDDNHADALCLLAYTMDKRGGANEA